MELRFYWKNTTERFFFGTKDELIEMIMDNYTEEDFFSMVGECYKWELPIIGEVDPEKCFNALAPELLDECIEEGRTSIADEVMQLLGDAKPWEIYDSYGFDIFTTPACISKKDYPKFMEKIKNFLGNTDFPF